MNAIKKFLAGMVLMGTPWLLAGCAEVVVPGTLVGAGEYYDYTTENDAHKTFMATADEITRASRAALKKMDIQLHEVQSVDGETELTAATIELDIRINMQPVTATTAMCIFTAKPIRPANWSGTETFTSGLKASATGFSRSTRVRPWWILPRLFPATDGRP